MANRFADTKLEALAIGFASHALLDAIPHNDEALEIALTTAIGAALLTHQVMQREDVDWELFLTGGLGGILPDGEHFLKRNGFIDRSLYPSHNGTIKQPRTEPVWALWFELGVAVVAFKVGF
ncbi:MAG: hypothetical protein GX063_08710 [Firmicutes bacterium]|nr:hypothetical protein [Bacillota bacterium]